MTGLNPGQYLIKAYIGLAGNDRKTYANIKLNTANVASLAEYAQNAMTPNSIMSALINISSTSDKITINAYSNEAWAGVNRPLILTVEKL